jgi:hypothetical protein
MKRNSPFGVGRLMRAAICGLLAATVIPAAALAAAPVATGPFTTLMANPCFATDGTLLITGHSTLYSDFQPDGSLRFYVAVNGSAVSTVTGAKYTFSEQLHEVFDVDFNNIRFYDYRKLNRQAEASGVPIVVDPPTGSGDDWFMRMYFEVPGATGGGPSNSSVQTTFAGECR